MLVVLILFTIAAILCMIGNITGLLDKVQPAKNAVFLVTTALIVAVLWTFYSIAA